MVNILCNLCGESCNLEESGFSEPNGLIEAKVRGGYFSTPGNGSGALDDGVTYTFSLCEFCLDYLFDNCVIPVKCKDMDGPLEFETALSRVNKDEWRDRYKQLFIRQMNERSSKRKI